MTGHTPPTRDVKVRRSTSLSVRRSLDTNLGAVGDRDLQNDLEDYFRRYGNLQKHRVRPDRESSRQILRRKTTPVWSLETGTI